MYKILSKAALSTVLILSVTGCMKGKIEAVNTNVPEPTSSIGGQTSPSASASARPALSVSPSPAGSAVQSTKPTPTPSKQPTPVPSAPKGSQGSSVQVVAQPESISVLVNKQFALPENYEPNDLVYPDVAFVFKEKIEKRKMRKEAAAALENMFAGAKKDGIYLAGVSAYRSHETQKALFKRYVEQDGEEKARTYSAVPGTSEHETGLAIDISGSDGKCAAQDCFGVTKEAKWLAENADQYGFIIRYLKGKESITGYQYEPWHLRFVGTKLSKEIAQRGITLEEYYNAVPVIN